MPCTQLSGVTLCRTTTIALRRMITRCPTCECKTEMVIQFPNNPFYGPTIGCTKCGESWADGERLPRPFYRGWRAHSAARFRALWADATYARWPDYSDWFAATEKATEVAR